MRAKVHLARSEDLSYRRELAEALRLNPSLLPVRLELAQALTAANGTPAALDVLNAAPDFQRHLPALLIQRNWTNWTAKNYAEMRKGVDQGLTLETSVDLLLQDGMLKLQAGNPAGAQGAFEQALKIDPQDFRALAALSEMFAARKQPGIAVQKVREYVAGQPKSAPAQELLGLLLLANGDHAQARAAFVAAAAADPLFVRADLDLARLNALEGKWEEARDSLKKVIAANPENATALQWLGDVEATKGDLDAAIEQYRRAVDKNPKNRSALNNLAYLLAEHRKQPDEALKYAERAAELQPDDPNTADTLGWILYQKGLYDVAIRHLKHATRHENVVYKYHLAMAYARAGQKANALATLEAALKKNSKVPEAQAASALIAQVK